MTNPILLDLPTPILTQRLILRPPMANDGAALNEATLETYDQLYEFMNWAKTKPSVADSEEWVRLAHAKWIKREYLPLMIISRADNSLLGVSGFPRMNWDIPWFEIAYWIRTSRERNGYASESVNALTRYAFAQLRARRVQICCQGDNEKSQALAIRLGFALEGRYGSFLTKSDGRICDSLVFARYGADNLPAISAEWEKS